MGDMVKDAEICVGYPGFKTTKVEIKAFENGSVTARITGGFPVTLGILEAEPELKSEAKAYRIGQIFTSFFGNDFILAMATPDECCLLSLTSGNRYVNPIKVGNCYRITREEFLKMGGCDSWQAKG